MRLTEKEKNRQFHQRLFDASVLVLVVKNMCESSFILGIRPEFVDALFVLIFLGFIFGKLATQHYKKWQIVLLFSLIMLSIYSCVKMKFFYLFFTVFCIAGCQDVDLQVTMKKSAKLKSSILLVHVILYLLAIVVAPSWVVYSYRDAGVPRYTFYMGHANTFAMYMLWIILELWFANYEKLNILSIWMMWGVLAITYIFTDSNTGMIVGTAAGVLLTITKIWKNHKMNGIRFMAKWIFGLFSVFFSATCVFYTKLSGILLLAYKALNKALTGRLLFGACTYDLKGFSWLGKQLSFPKKFYWRGYWMDMMVYDNSYIWLFVSYGVVFMALIAVGFLCINKRLTKIEAIMIFSYSLYGVMENYILNSVLCFPILFIGKYIFEEKEKTRKLQNREEC